MRNLGWITMLLAVMIWAGCDTWDMGGGPEVDDDDTTEHTGDDDDASDDDAADDDAGDDDDDDASDDDVGDDDLGDDDTGDDDTGGFDGDGDGTPESTDCDDHDPALNQNDVDGDGWSTCWGDCNDNNPFLNLDDADGDGVTSCDGDCDDNDATAYPGAFEDTADGVDNDCDGQVDEAVVCDCPATGDFAEAIDACSGVLGVNTWGDVNQYQIIDAYGPALSPRNGCRAIGLHSGNMYEPVAQMGEWLHQNPTVEWDFTGYTASCGNPPPPGNDSKYDLTWVDIAMQVPQGVNSFSVDFYFASSEYIEWVCTAFNDTFEMYLESSALNPADFPDHDGDGIPEGNIAFDGNGLPITVNNNYFVVTDCQTMYNLPGFSGQGYTGIVNGTACSGPSGNTTEAGATGWLTTTAPVTPGETIKLKFSIWDEGDGIYDSVVFIDNFQWHAAPQTDPDTG
jgi:hypothetical protein